MSLTAIILIGIAIMQFILEHSKKNQNNSKATQNKKIKKGVLIENIDSKSNLDKSIDFKPIRNEIRKRKIVDREKEIITNNYDISKERIIDDIIYSEILKKPKSKR